MQKHINIYAWTIRLKHLHIRVNAWYPQKCNMCERVRISLAKKNSGKSGRNMLMDWGKSWVHRKHTRRVGAAWRVSRHCDQSVSRHQKEEILCPDDKCGLCNEIVNDHSYLTTIQHDNNLVLNIYQIFCWSFCKSFTTMEIIFSHDCVYTLYTRPFLPVS